MTDHASSLDRLRAKKNVALEVLVGFSLFWHWQLRIYQGMGVTFSI